MEKPMLLPEALTQALRNADEEYLTAISNKGTVKRAEKDLSGITSPEVSVEGELCRVKLGETEVCLRAPLIKSSCSCPSDSVCRHRIAAILWLRQSVTEDRDPEETEDRSPEKTAASEDDPLTGELTAYPTERLLRQLGIRRLNAVRNAAAEGTDTLIREGRTVTVELPWEPASVHFFSPLEQSRCSCRSSSFCPHKAEALLLWKLRHGQIKTEDLMARESDPPDPAAVHETCSAAKKFLTGCLTEGLCRLSPGSREDAERLAELSHLSALPSLERAMRRICGGLSSCFSRSAAYRTEELLRSFSDAWKLAASLDSAAGTDPEKAAALAGKFRDAYGYAGDLSLYMLGIRSVTAEGGYSGMVSYFRDTEKDRYYCFKNLRPIFYGTGEHPDEPVLLPWGLLADPRRFLLHTISLKNAFVSRDGSLSSTEQSSAYPGKKCLPGDALRGVTPVTDFSLLLGQAADPDREGTGRLALLQPVSCEVLPFDPIGQLFCLRLLDHSGRDLWIRIRYREKDRTMMDFMEELAQKLRKQPSPCPVFFGRLYCRDDLLCLDPVSYYPKWRTEYDGIT